VGQEEDLDIPRVELDAESDDLDWLIAAIDAIARGPSVEAAELFEQDREQHDEKSGDPGGTAGRT
jgi:hypothetical protein